jgi:7,8-dihydropterin-6-yl-methyl-4-(beta-D-ribofuranosyl)aminobenzene 5'-phosphate synthase
MKNHITLGILALALTSLLKAQPAQLASEPKQSLTVLSHATVTVLVDNMAGGGSVLGEWGAGFLIETDQHQILFDTGGGEVLLGNARALQVDLTKTEAIVFSHGHEDHTGGLEKALTLCKSADLFVHPAAFETKYWKEDSGAVSFTFPIPREQLLHRVHKIVETKAPTLIRDGVMVTGEIPRLNDFEDTGIRGFVFLDSSMTTEDPILDDQALFFRVPEGVVILLGCGHSGVVNTIEYVSKLTGEQHIYAVIGGTHLLNASPSRMQKTIESLRKYDVQKIMLSHCTGVRAFAQLANAFPGRCSWPASGTRIKFGAR